MSPNLSILRIDARKNDYRESLNLLRKKLSPDGDVVSEKGKQLTERVFGELLSPQQVVERICSDVRKHGDAALLRYSQALDGTTLQADQLRVPLAMLEEAHRNATPDYLAAIRKIRANITGFQKAILHTDIIHRPVAGIELMQRYLPLRRIGICVPGGAAAYPSTVLMTVIPAQAAGVDEIAVVAPPTALGAYNPDVLAVCYELGVREVYAMGGAQAVAAMAYGTETVPGVDKIVGPGNLFVALAKKWVFGHVDIDSIAGPSEVIVVADASTNPRFAAMDMLAQAEHSPGSSVLITWDESWVESTLQALEGFIAELSRGDLARASLEAFGAVIVVSNADQACEIINELAPEHLHLSCENPRSLLPKIRNSGATFVGAFSPVALGDYAAGPSHVLPTSGTARWASGLSSNDFLRAGSVIEYSRDALAEIAPEIAMIANKEGLTAHRESVEIRVQDRP